MASAFYKKLPYCQVILARKDHGVIGEAQRSAEKVRKKIEADLVKAVGRIREEERNPDTAREKIRTAERDAGRKLQTFEGTMEACSYLGEPCIDHINDIRTAPPGFLSHVTEVYTTFKMDASPSSVKAISSPSTGGGRGKVISKTPNRRCKDEQEASGPSVQGESVELKRFNQIAGLADAKKTIEEQFIWPNQNPNLFQGLLEPDRGMLLFGPPGNGKTLIAKAIAGEAGWVFRAVRTTDFLSANFGDSDKKFTEVFDEMKTAIGENKRGVLFFDEIDAILSARGGKSESEVMRRLKNLFLQLTDGIGQKSRIMVIGATNFPHQLDDAALRRLTQMVEIPLPDLLTIRHLILLYVEEYQKTIDSFRNTCGDETPAAMCPLPRVPHPPSSKPKSLRAHGRSSSESSLSALTGKKPSGLLPPIPLHRGHRSSPSLVSPQPDAEPKPSKVTKATSHSLARLERRVERSSGIGLTISEEPEDEEEDEFAALDATPVEETGEEDEEEAGGEDGKYNRCCVMDFSGLREREDDSSFSIVEVKRESMTITVRRRSGAVDEEVDETVIDAFDEILGISSTDVCIRFAGAEGLDQFLEERSVAGEKGENELYTVVGYSSADVMQVVKMAARLMINSLTEATGDRNVANIDGEVINEHLKLLDNSVIQKAFQLKRPSNNLALVNTITAWGLEHRTDATLKPDDGFAADVDSLNTERETEARRADLVTVVDILRKWVGWFADAAADTIKPKAPAKSAPSARSVDFDL
eukprot:GILK01001290.1.p1 GENE.GILK01001290.1~~GILK01001290.1.p1  ORF type:complete len:826 (+),score=149.48 GILK01001290.1:213-2480(+)